MTRKKWLGFRDGFCLGVAAIGYGCRQPPEVVPLESKKTTVALSSFQARQMQNLSEQVARRIRYQGGYFADGEPPPEMGVCTDVISRAFRGAGVHLKTQVDADIAAHPEAYPLRKPDPNIDYRRCRNLLVFFRRHAQALTTSPLANEYLPGDVVFWSTHRDDKPDHVGMVGDVLDRAGVPAVVQHWPGRYVEKTSGLFGWQIVGHFRWRSAHSAARQRFLIEGRFHQSRQGGIAKEFLIEVDNLTV